jgi:hypothetical protein
MMGVSSLGPAWRLGPAASATLAAAAPAIAAPAPNPDAVFARACANRTGPDISQLRLGEALLIEAGLIPPEFVAAELAAPAAGVSPANIYQAALIGRLGTINDRDRQTASDQEAALLRGIDVIENRLAGPVAQENSALTLAGPRPTGRGWLFRSAQPEWTLTCKATDPAPTFVADIEKGGPRAPISIRQKPEELALVGDERRAAGAFQLGFQRTRTRQDDGGIQKETDFSIDGTAGARLTSPLSPTDAYVYGRYQLQRARTRPRPQLDAGATEGDDDTDALETGLLFHGQLTRNDSTAKLFLDAQIAAVFDFNNDASRSKLRSLFRPVIDANLGLCGLKSYARPIRGLPLATRCKFQLDVEGAQVLKRGLTPLGTFDNFLAAGLKAEFEAFLPTAEWRRSARNRHLSRPSRPARRPGHYRTLRCQPQISVLDGLQGRPRCRFYICQGGE